MGRTGRGVAACVLSALLVTACQSGTTTPGVPTPTETPDPSPTVVPEPTTLKIAVYGDETAQTAYQTIATAFEVGHPDVHIDLTDFASAAEVTSALLSPSLLAPQFDAFLTDDTHLAAAVTAGMTQPVDALMEERNVEFGDVFQRTALTQFSTPGALACMPTEMSPRVMYVNKRLVPKFPLTIRGISLPSATSSWSWDAFEATARAIVAADPSGRTVGVAITPDFATVTALLRSQLLDSVDDVLDPTTTTLGSDQAAPIMRQLTEFFRDPSVSLTPEQLARRSARDWFTAGRLGLFEGTRADLPALRATRHLRFDVLPLPGFGKSRDVSEVKGLCLSASTTLLDEAADFVAYSVGPEAQQVIAETGTLVPVRLDSVASDSFVQPGERPASEAVFASMLRRSDPMPYAAAWPDVLARADRIVRRVLIDPSVDLDVTGPDLLDRLDAKSQILLAPPPS